MFADDCLDFWRATKKAERSIQYIFDHYSKVSGQLVNHCRSKIQFPKGICTIVKNEISDILQIALSDSIGTYLGCSNIGKERNKEDFDEFSTK